LNHGERILWILFELVATNAIFLDIVFWSLLFTGSIDSYGIVAHAVNTLVVLLELALNRMTFIWTHWLWNIAYGIIYLIFAWIFHAKRNE
jgi:hypothetical protein